MAGTTKKGMSTVDPCVEIHPAGADNCGICISCKKSKKGGAVCTHQHCEVVLKAQQRALPPGWNIKNGIAHRCNPQAGNFT